MKKHDMKLNGVLNCILGLLLKVIYNEKNDINTQELGQ